MDPFQILILTMCENQLMEANKIYSITFEVINPQRIRGPPDVSISMKGSLGIPEVAMDQPGNTTKLFNIPGAADPLYITTPGGFYASQIDICEICPEDFYCEPPLTLQPCPDRSHSPQQSDSFSDCKCEPGMYMLDRECKVCPADFWCGGPQASPDIVACPAQSASLTGSSRPWDCIVELDLKRISQNNPFYSCKFSFENNTLELRLRSPANIASHVEELASRPATIITVTGLGSVGQAGELVTVRGQREGGGPEVSFCDGNDTHVGRWHPIDPHQALFLTMCENQEFQADANYSITVNVTNPQHTQPSPSVNIAIIGSVMVTLVAMDKPGLGTEIEGIAGAADPLFVTTPPGYYVSGTDICRECEENFWCPGDNVRSACPEQSTAPALSTSRSDCWCNAGWSGYDCELCPPGFWCEGGPNRRTCPAQTTSDAGSTRSRDCIVELGLKSISQTIPFYSCEGSATLNTLELRLRSPAVIESR
eukprot:2481317-Rhodomonas_salina.1